MSIEYAAATSTHLKLPPVVQIAYLVPDLDKACRFWATHLSVGPFIRIDHIRFALSNYKGKELPLDLSIALAWREGIQVELMQQHSLVASVFTDYAPPGGGFHHLGIRTTDIKADGKKLQDAGLVELQRNVSESGTETIFFGGEPPFGVIELIHVPGGGTLSEKLKQAALSWDGKEPYIQ